jgi:hypothetical protein
MPDDNQNFNSRVQSPLSASAGKRRRISPVRTHVDAPLYDHRPHGVGADLRDGRGRRWAADSSFANDQEIAVVPEKKTIERARQDAREGKAPSTQAGEFVREEMDHIREGKHGARSTKQAIAIGLSKARRAGVELPPPKNGNKETRTKAAQDSATGRTAPHRKPSAKRSRAASAALKREGRKAASHSALSRQARSSARNRTSGKRT